jgi:serine protease Do
MRRWPLALCCLIAGGLAGAFLAGPLLQGQAPPAPAVPRELTSYRQVVKKVLPAVVSIEAPGRKTAGDHEPPEVGFGSGVVIDPAGVILTNYHVVAGAEEVVVYLSDGSKVKTRDILTDSKTDVALVRIEPPGKLAALPLGDSDAMEIGDRVLAIGAPFGLTGSVTHGIISSKGRALHMNMYEDYVQTDAAVNPGNSGGPLVNLSGEVIGINSVIKSKDGGFQGVGLAISSNLARRIMGRLLRDGVVRRGYLGVQVGDIEDPAVARRVGVPEKGGVLVRQVFPNTPGQKGGLRKGDVITAIAGKPIGSTLKMQSVVADLPPGKATTVTVLRDGRAQTLRVTIEEQPGDFGTRRGPSPARNPDRPT